MRNWLRHRTNLFLTIVFLFLLLGVTLVAGLGGWGTGGVALLSLATLASGIGFAMGIFFVIQSRQRYAGKSRHALEQELQYARERIFQLTEELRRETGQLMTERDRAEFLRQSFTELASTLEPRHVLGGILQGAIEAVGAEHGSILLLDERGRPKEALFSRKEGTGGVGPRTEDIFQRGLAGWVVENRCAEIIFDTAQDARWLSFPGDEKPARSVIAVPFARRERALGVMVLTHPVPFQFGEMHMSLLQQLAQEAAICLENADLYTMAEGERTKLAAILEGMTEPVIVVDVEGQILLLNRAAERVFGVSSGQAIGRPLEEAVGQRFLAELCSQARACGEAVSGELSTADERVHFCCISPIPGLGWVAILQDITYFKELDRLKSEFVSTVSHDLRSPLTRVRGYADLLPVLGPLTEEQQDFLGRIGRAVTQMAELISDLLDLGKIEAGIDMELLPLPIGDIVADAAESQLPAAVERGVNLHVELQQEVPAVLGNGGRIRQVVSNLVSNAIKYTPAGGQVSVRLFRDDGEVVLAVADNGLGIAPEDQARLFEKFYRVQTPETEGIPGTGLGLAICRSIVEQHGGRIWVHSTPGQGSTFSVSLPVFEAGAEVEPPGVGLPG